MKIVLNPDKETVETVRASLKRTGGYCPCRLQQTEDTKCRCTEFREQTEDPNFEGFCHCLLFFKSLSDDEATAKAQAKEAMMAMGWVPEGE